MRPRRFVVVAFVLIVLIVLIILSSNALAGPATPADLPIGGGFEQSDPSATQPAGWHTVPRFADGDPRAVLTWADDVAHGGRRSVAIAIDPAVPGQDVVYNWTTTVADFRIGATYELGGWVKAEDLTAPASLIVQCWNGDHTEQLAFATTEGDYVISGTTDWTRVWTVVTVPEGTASVVIRALGAATAGKGGAVWYDDIVLRELAPDDRDDGPGALEGSWQGTLYAGTELRLVLHVDRGRSGWDVSLDSVDQGANGLRVVNLDLRDGEVSFAMTSPPASYSGRLTSEGIIEGTWRQGMGLPLNFQRLQDGTAPPERSRPQMPQPPFPYADEEVSYSFDPADVPGTLEAGAREGDDVITLRGTLTLPAGEGPHPAVLLISGSGAQDRDESLFGHKPFRVLADHLSRRGLAVLRVDDRGHGQSTGDHAAATTADFALDAAAGFLYLQQRPDIDAARVALLGHSEGGLIAPLVAAAYPEVAAIVLMAGPGVDGAAILRLQERLMLEAAGATPDEVAAAGRHQDVLLGIMAGGFEGAELEARLEQYGRDSFADLPPAEQAAAGSVDQYVALVKRQMLSPWVAWFLAHDPAPVLRQIRCPVLAVNGERDTQVDADQNLPPIAAALAAGGNPDATTLVLPELNHLFQRCETGAGEEYATIEETLAPEFLSTVTEWLWARLGVGVGR